MTARAAFRPRPGTIGAKMLAHLQSLPAGTRLASAALAEAIGQPGDTRNLLAGAARYLETGLLKDGWIEGTRHRWWALGDGVPPADAKPDEDDEDRSEQEATGPLNRTPVTLPDPRIGSIFTMFAADLPTAAAQVPAQTQATLPPPPPGLGWHAPAKPCAPQADAALQAKFDALLAAATDVDRGGCRPPPGATLRQAGTRQRNADRAESAGLRARKQGPFGQFTPAEQRVLVAAAAELSEVRPVTEPDAPDTPPEEAIEPDGQGFRCTLWSSGEIVLRLCTGHIVRLCVEDATVLVNYLCRITATAARSA